AHDHGIAIGFLAYRRGNAYGAARSAPIVSNDVPVVVLAELVGDQAGQNVGTTPRREGNDEANGLGWIVCGLRQDTACSGETCQSQHTGSEVPAVHLVRSPYF